MRENGQTLDRPQQKQEYEAILSLIGSLEQESGMRNLPNQLRQRYFETLNNNL